MEESSLNVGTPEVDIGSAAGTPPVGTNPVSPPVSTKAPPPSKPVQSPTIGERGGDVPDNDPKPAPVSDWPDNWRELMAGGDEAELKRLKRFDSPLGVHKWARNAERKISSGGLKPVKPDTEDEAILSKWREQVGVPPTPAGYYDSLGDVDYDESDKGALDFMFSSMHKEGVPADQAAKIVKQYYDLQTKAEAQRLESDLAFREEAEDNLRSEYGPDYRKNLNVMAMLIKEFGGQKVEAKLFGARTPDGRMLGDDPDVIRFLVSAARAYYPDGEIAETPGADASSYIDTIERELDGLREEMQDTRTWHKKEDKHKRYQDLLILKEKAEKRRKT